MSRVGYTQLCSVFLCIFSKTTTTTTTKYIKIILLNLLNLFWVCWCESRWLLPTKKHLHNDIIFLSSARVRVFPKREICFRFFVCVAWRRKKNYEKSKEINSSVRCTTLHQHYLLWIENFDANISVLPKQVKICQWISAMKYSRPLQQPTSENWSAARRQRQFN